MNSFTHTRLLALLLATIGLGIFATKVLQLDYPMTPGERTTTWDFEIYLDFDTSNQPVRLETYIPSNDRKVLRYRARLLGETVDSPLPESMQRKLRRAAPETENDLERQAFLVWSTDLRRRSADDESLADLVLEEIFVDGDVDEVEALLSPTLARPIARLATS